MTRPYADDADAIDDPEVCTRCARPCYDGTDARDVCCECVTCYECGGGPGTCECVLTRCVEMANVIAAAARGYNPVAS